MRSDLFEKTFFESAQETDFAEMDDLSSVSGAITADRIRSARGLRFGSGDVVVTGRTISGSQVYR